MASSLSLYKDAASTGDYGGDGHLTYEVTTSDTQVTIALKKISGILYRRKSASVTTGITSTMTYTISMTGATSASLSGTYKSSAVNGKSLSTTKTINRTHASQTVKLSATLKYAADSGEATVSQSNSVTITIPARPSYAVTYNANGGSGAPSAQTKWHGEALTLSSAKPTRANYAFKRWNTKTADSGTAYGPGASYTANAALVLYAIWNPIVTYNANGGSGAPSAQTKTYGTALTLTTSKPTRSGYTFKCWNTKANGTGTDYSSGAKYASESPMTLYAIWNPIVTYDANGGSGAPSAQTKTYGEALTLQTTTPTRTGHVFDGWNTAKDGSGTRYAAGGSYTSNTAVTLYAQWARTPDAPTISSLTVIRCNASGAQDDEGTCCRVTAMWAVDTSAGTVSGNTGTVAGKIAAQGGTTRSFTFSSGSSGTSGTATAIVSGCDIDMQYAVSVTVTDKASSTTRLAILTRAHFELDFKRGGGAIGIGCAAPSEGLEVGYNAQFDGDASIAGNATVAGTLKVDGSLEAPELTVASVSSDVATSGTGWTVYDQYAYTYGKVCMVRIGLRPASEVAADKVVTLGSLLSGYRPRNSQGFANTYGVGIVSSGGSISFRPLVALSASTTVYVALTFIRN